MKNESTKHLFERLESIRNEVEGVEFWSARDLQEVFGYDRWENFHKAVKRAAISIENSPQELDLHFREVTKTSKMPNGGVKKLKDYALTRYACYLVAQNGDPKKEEIAFAQSYFAVQTRKQELIEKRFSDGERVSLRDKLTETEKVLSELVHQRNGNFGYIRAMGDKGLFGGLTTQQMKDKLEVPKNRALADYLPDVSLKAKDLATDITNINILNKDLDSTESIADEHFENNDEVRNLLIRRGVYPENLPAGEDIKKIRRRLKSEAKKLNAKKKK